MLVLTQFSGEIALKCMCTAVPQVLVDTERDGHRVSFNEAFKQKGKQMMQHSTADIMLSLVETRHCCSSSPGAVLRVCGIGHSARCKGSGKNPPAAQLVHNK
jgi:hypothetical protein